MQQEELKRMAAPRQITNASTGAEFAPDCVIVNDGDLDRLRERVRVALKGGAA